MYFRLLGWWALTIAALRYLTAFELGGGAPGLYKATVASFVLFDLFFATEVCLGPCEPGLP